MISHNIGITESSNPVFFHIIATGVNFLHFHEKFFFLVFRPCLDSTGPFEEVGKAIWRTRKRIKALTSIDFLEAARCSS